jgi:hypothetical protein
MPRAGRLCACLFALLRSALGAQEAPIGPIVQAFVFGDVLYTETEGAASEGFHLGQMVAHGNVLLTDRVAFFGEVSLTARDTGYGIEVERAILRYDFSDALKVSAGRYHTPISYWNTAFHHGLWLQGSVARPEAVRFGSRFIPVHFVGAVAEGRIPRSPQTYEVGVGNGRAAEIARAGDAGDVNAARAIVVSAAVQPGGLLGFRLGGGIYLDDVPTIEPGGADERIVNAHAVWDRGRVELIGEYIRLSHEGGSPAVEATSTATYLHAGVKLGGDARRVTPYLRWERTEVDEDDMVFGGDPTDYEAILGGVRWDFSDLAALKVELRSEEFGGADRVASFFIQGSFAIPLFAG